MDGEEVRLPVPGTPDCWFRAAHVAKVHDTCSPVGRRILYNMGRWARNQWRVTPRMFDRASRALHEVLTDEAARQEWVDELDAVSLRVLVDGFLRLANRDDNEAPDPPAIKHIKTRCLCARCGNGWSFDAGEDCPRCGAVASRIWWFEANGQATEVQYVRRHGWFRR